MNRKAEAIELKLTKAKSLLSEIDGLMNMRFYTTAISRLYYSCYHATRALLLTIDLVPKTHKGVSKMLHEHFVNKDLFNIDHAAFYNNLMHERIDDDYNDHMISDENEVIAFIDPTKAYVAYIETLIHAYLSAPDTPGTFNKE
ncbi:HEPN domain-containing protein [Segetibacter sp. 3557_3]|uniref:HEPN domain-containing protein n=1 Tax=Segetibacter sp. 3557_3 TaxID=2547429 RepID=UPI001058C767|nr:HEPN domain-containing protein [Segetibacter sp. 3557_3]TDH26411.1 HEPN domain-containing protein [Segetibacter sp. 3557_3]